MNLDNLTPEIIDDIFNEWKHLESLENIIKRGKEDFLKNKFRSEIENLKLGTMQDYLKYYFKFFKVLADSISASTIYTLFEVMNGTNKKPNVIVFANGGHAQFDVFTFEKGKGKDFISQVPVFASLIDGEFKIHSEMYIPHQLYLAENYEFVLENF